MELAECYEAYVKCLIEQDWGAISNYVDDDVMFNGFQVGLKSYIRIVQTRMAKMVGIHLVVESVVIDPPVVTAKLLFSSAPLSPQMGSAITHVNSRFSEHVYYEFSAGKINNIWSISGEANPTLRGGKLPNHASTARRCDSLR